MKEIKEQIEKYNHEISQLQSIHDSNRISSITRPAIRTQIESLIDFKSVLIGILSKIQKTETSDSLLLDKLDKVVEGYDDILISYDHEDGYFISMIERGYNRGKVMDKDLSAKRKNLRDAFQAAIDFNPK